MTELRPTDPHETPSVQHIAAREVPLGGIRAMTVRRTLPHRERAFVGAWCFADHYGPQPVGEGNRGSSQHDGMDVPPHPHTGLQTVSWLFEGQIEHRDTGGVVGLVDPGHVNLMSAGRGIAHSEVSTCATTQLHGVQLWVVLPSSARDGARGFQHHEPARMPLPAGREGQAAGSALVFIGELPGVDSSPVETATPLLGAQLDLEPDARVELAVDPTFEHGVLLDEGALTVAGMPLGRADLAVIDAGPRSILLEAGPEGARTILLGGTPFDEEIVMWWNFIAADHDGIVAAREEWMRHGERFGQVQGYAGETQHLPAPPLPATRLLPRGRFGTARPETGPTSH